jgi:hypothetical protein
VRIVTAVTFTGAASGYTALVDTVAHLAEILIIGEKK